MRLSRAQYNCPSDLAKIIEEVNILPADFHFSFEQLIERNRDRIVPYSLDILEYEYFRELPEALKSAMLRSKEVKEAEKEDAFEYWLNNDGKAMDRVQDFCLDHDYSDEVTEKMMSWDSERIAHFLVGMGYYGEEYSRYAQVKREAEENEDEEEFYDFGSPIWNGAFKALFRLEEARNFLLAVVELGANLVGDSFPGDEPQDVASQQRKFLARQAENSWRLKKLSRRLMASEVTIDSNRHINFGLSEWARAINGVDITRVRRCEVCDKIFWANRRDAFACTKEHSKVRQMRLLRVNWRENGNLYKKARKQRVKNGKETQ
jgi:hypothetical protein